MDKNTTRIISFDRKEMFETVIKQFELDMKIQYISFILVNVIFFVSLSIVCYLKYF